MKTQRQRAAKRNKLDALLKRIILRRDHGRCFTCQREGTDASHYLGKKAFPAIRFDEENLHIQCRACHTAHHMGSDDYQLKMLSIYGEEALSALRGRGRASTPSLDEVEERLAEMSRQTV